MVHVSRAFGDSDRSYAPFLDMVRYGNMFEMEIKTFHIVKYVSGTWPWIAVELPILESD
jgi:hypothetical protein